MKEKRRIWVGVISAILAVLVFIAALCVQMTGREEVTYVTVAAAKASVAGNTVLTASNLDTLLELRQIPEEYVPREAVTSLDGLEGMVIAQMSAGSILTEAMVSRTEDLYADYRELFWASVSTDQLSQAVAGTLRAGDYVDLYCVVSDGEGSVCTLLKENVRVKSVLTKSGEEIENADEASLAQLFVIPLERAEIAAFYEALSHGSLLIAKSNA